MTRYEYLLYDNRTLGLGSFDWSLKVATGPLRNDRPSRRKFVEYCEDSFDSRTATLRHFRTALGGVCLTAGKYLVCVTLEIRDRSGRDSCAFVGIFCPDSVALAKLLRGGDPILMAQSVFEKELPPSYLTLQGSPLAAAVPPVEPVAAGPRLRPFRVDSSPKEAAEIILERGASKTLPSILGVAAWTAESADALKAYDYAFCQNLPIGFADGEDRFAPRDGHETFGGLARPKWAVVFAGIAGAILLLASFFSIQRGNTPKDAEPSGAGGRQPAAAPSSMPQGGDQILRDSAAELFLARFGAILDQLEVLSSEQLLQTEEYKTLEAVAVMERHAEKRSVLLGLLKDDLPNFKAAIEAQNYRHFYQASLMARLAPSDRAAEIRERLASIQPPSTECRLLGTAFGRWTDRAGSVTGEWCDLVEAVAKELNE